MNMVVAGPTKEVGRHNVSNDAHLETVQDWPASGIAPVIIEAGERETFAGTNMGRRRELASAPAA